ncbi:MAG TPA: serine/threonine-protein kinase, partial [Candidatus Limnocylindria bacterium]|nr:serine/threonine-protein kinase [Candidatus Limnocylindria bacterium]
MNPADRLKSPLAGTCPRCKRAVAPDSSSLGVCLRCAAERLFDSGIFGFTGERNRLASPAASGGTATALPEWIGDYEVLEELGRGGMGRVFVARQAGLGRIVALKAIAGDERGSSELELRFLREAQTSARLRHPNIVAVHDSGRADGWVYFSMDFVEDGDLAHALKQRPWGTREAANLTAQVARALSYAHAEGVVHRDIKPSNILLEGGVPKIADFGLAAELGVGGDLTQFTCVLGTPQYLAPEALQGGSKRLGPLSDIYALGVVLYEMLTGRTPYAGASPAELPALIERDAAPSPRLLAPAVPRDLETICLKCLEREASRRYPSALALAEDLERFLRGEAILARPLSQSEALLRWCRRRPALATVWVLVTALAIGSTLSAVLIQQTLNRAVKAESDSRERLRESRLAQARAVRRTVQPGRRAEALTALTEAYKIRPGEDVREEIIAALLVPDIRPLESWRVPAEMGEINFDPRSRLAAFSKRAAIGQSHEPAIFYHWGATNSFSRIETHGVGVLGQLRFNREGTMVLSRAVDDSVRLWRVGEPEPLWILRGRPGPGAETQTEAFNDDYDFSPDGQFVAVGLPEKGVSLHRLADGKEVGRWLGGNVFTRVRFSPDGRRLAALDGARAPVRDVFVIGIPKMTLVNHLNLGASPNSVAWSSDSRLLAVSEGDNTIGIHDSASGRLLSSIHSPVRDPNEIVFLGGDSLLAMRGFGTVLHILNVPLGREELAINGFGPSALSATVDGARFTAALLGSLVTRWEVVGAAGYTVLPPPRPNGYEQAFNNCCLDISPDGKWMLCGHGRYMLLRETATGRLVAEMDDGDEFGMEYTTVGFGPEGKSIVRHSNSTGFRRYPLALVPGSDPVLGEPAIFAGASNAVMADRSLDGRRFAVVSAQGQWVRVYEVDGDGQRLVGQLSTTAAYGAALSPDGTRILVTCGDPGPPE